MEKYTVSWAPSDLGRRSDCYKIVVHGLADDITDHMLKETFRTPYPSVKAAGVVTEDRNGRFEGYGFVSFEDEIEYLRAISEMDGKFCSTSQMRVQPATIQNIRRAQNPTEFLRKGQSTKTVMRRIGRSQKLMQYVEPDILHKIAVQQPVLCKDFGTETVSFGVCLGSKDGLDWPSENWERSDICKDAGFDQIAKCVVNWVNLTCIQGIVFGICTKSCDLPQKTCAKAPEVIKFVKDLSEKGILKDVKYTYWSHCDAYSLMECMKMSNGWDLDICKLFEKSFAYAVLQTFLRANVQKRMDQPGPSSQ